MITTTPTMFMIIITGMSTATIIMITTIITIAITTSMIITILIVRTPTGLMRMRQPMLGILNKSLQGVALSAISKLLGLALQAA